MDAFERQIYNDLKTYMSSNRVVIKESPRLNYVVDVLFPELNDYIKSKNIDLIIFTLDAIEYVLNLSALEDEIDSNIYTLTIQSIKDILDTDFAQVENKIQILHHCLEDTLNGTW